MSAIHFKFSSSNQYQTITFDGMYMSLFELKKAIMEKLKLKSTEAGLNLTNAQTLKGIFILYILYIFYFINSIYILFFL